MMLLCGQRSGEVQKMRWEDIQIGQHIIRIADAHTGTMKEVIGNGAWWTQNGEPTAYGWPGTKNGQTNRVWLTEEAVKLLHSLGVKDEGWVFANRNGKPYRVF